MKKIFWRAVFSLTLMVGLLFSGIHLVFAVQAPSLLTPGESSRMNYSYGGAGTAYDAQAGNVTQLDLSGKQVTTHWAGFYGNVSGSITLEDALGNVFYNWSGLGSPIGEIYASNTSTVAWSSIACANTANMSAVDSFLGMTSSNPDSVFKTYGSPSHSGFSVAGLNIGQNSCNSTNAHTNTGKNSAYFTQVLLADNRNVPVFATILNASATSFKNSGVDFQLLTGVPGSGTLYFFIELG
jgi:hypothetical protein